MKVTYSYNNPERNLKVIQTDQLKLQNMWCIKFDNSLLWIKDEANDLRNFIEEYGYKIGQDEEKNSSYDFAKFFVDSGFNIEKIHINGTDDMDLMEHYEEFERLVELSGELTGVSPDIRYRIGDEGNHYYFNSVNGNMENPRLFIERDETVLAECTYDKNAEDKDKKIKFNLNASVIDNEDVNFASDMISVTGYARNAFENHVINLERNKKVLEEEKLYGESRRKSLMRNFTRTLDKISDWAKNKKNSMEDNYFETQIEKLKNKTLEKEKDYENLKKRRGNRKADKEGLTKRNTRNTVDVEFSKNNGVPVINITRNKNGIVEKLSVEYDGKTVGKDTDLYKALLNTKSPADVMNVLQENKLNVDKIDISIDSNIPELAAPMVNVLRNNLIFYGYDGKASINVAGKDNNRELESNIVFENKVMRQWDFSEKDLKNNTKSNLSIDGTGKILTNDIASDSVIKDCATYIYSAAKVDMQRYKDEERTVGGNNPDIHKDFSNKEETKKKVVETPEVETPQSDYPTPEEMKEAANYEQKQEKPDFYTYDVLTDKQKNFIVKMFEEHCDEIIAIQKLNEGYKDLCNDYNIIPVELNDINSFGLNNSLSSEVLRYKMTENNEGFNEIAKRCKTDIECIKKVISESDKFKGYEKAQEIYQEIFNTAKEITSKNDYERDFEYSIGKYENMDEKLSEIYSGDDIPIGDDQYIKNNSLNRAKIEAFSKLDNLIDDYRTPAEYDGKYSDSKEHKESLTEALNTMKNIIVEKEFEHIKKTSLVFAFDTLSGLNKKIELDVIQNIRDTAHKHYDETHPKLTDTIKNDVVAEDIAKEDNSKTLNNEIEI